MDPRWINKWIEYASTRWNLIRPMPSEPSCPGRRPTRTLSRDHASSYGIARFIYFPRCFPRWLHRSHCGRFSFALTNTFNGSRVSACGKNRARAQRVEVGRSGTGHEWERRSHVAHFGNTLAAQSRPGGAWSVERMVLRGCQEKGEGRRGTRGSDLALGLWKNFNNHFYFYCAHADNFSLLKGFSLLSSHK